VGTITKNNIKRGIIMNEYLIIFLRIISIMGLLLFCTLFIMGKRPIGELPVFDLLAIVVMGAIVGADIADPKIKHLPTAFAVVILALLQRTISIASVRSKKFRSLVNFEPTVVVHNGQLLCKNIKKISYTVSEVLMLLREKDIFDLDKVDYGVIEPSGNLSVLKKSEHGELTPKLMNIYTQESSIHTIVIFEGKLQKNNLNKTKFTEQYIVDNLKQRAYNNIEEVFFASIDKNGTMNVSSYEQVDVAIE